MAPAAEGIITVSYRPLATMDELHVLLLAAVSTRNNDTVLLEKLFSLPNNVVVKELSVLELYGLTQEVAGKWIATSRGQQIVCIWKTFQNRVKAEIRANAQQWLLGPGQFEADENTRDKNEIETLARGCGVADTASAVKFLDERRRAAKGFEAFVISWPPRANGAAQNDIFSETFLFANLRLAETDELLRRLEELLSAHIEEVVYRLHIRRSGEEPASTNSELAGAVASARKNSRDVMKKFDDARRSQRRENQRLAKVKTTCEGLLAGEWLSANVGSLLDAFNTEPAAFTFTSTVPFMQPEAPKQSTLPLAPSHPQLIAKPKQEEGVVRAFFRWLLG